MPPPQDARSALGSFDAAAADAQRLAPLLWDPVSAATLARSRPADGERVLDACCGTGPSALPAARAVGPHGLVDAVDLARSPVELLAAGAPGLLQLRTHVADVTSWPSGGYDLVQCVLGFFFPDPGAGTEHLVRCARPGGRVALATWRRGALASAGQALLRAVSAERDVVVPVPGPSALVQRIGDEAALAEWVADRGLVDAEVVAAPLTFPPDPTALWLLVLGSGFRGLLGGMDDAAVKRVRHDYLAQLLDGPPIDATVLIAVGWRR